VSAQLANLLAGIGGAGLVVLLTAAFARKKTSAETTDIITQAAQRVLVQVQARADGLEAEIAELRAASATARRQLEAEINSLANAVRKLAGMVRELGGDPDPVLTDVDVIGWHS
jgi:hypothetical protein